LEDENAKLKKLPAQAMLDSTGTAGELAGSCCVTGGIRESFFGTVGDIDQRILGN